MAPGPGTPGPIACGSRSVVAVQELRALLAACGLLLNSSGAPVLACGDRGGAKVVPLSNPAEMPALSAFPSSNNLKDLTVTFTSRAGAAVHPAGASPLRRPQGGPMLLGIALM